MIKDQQVTLLPNHNRNSYHPQTNSVASSSQKLLHCLAHMLTRLTCEAPQGGKMQSRFYCKTKPKIPIYDYLVRIQKLGGCSQFIFIKALIYMDRFQSSNSDFVLNELSVHRQIMCSVMIASKYSQDFYYSNCIYSKVGGFSEADMSRLQRQFLETIDFQLFVDAEEFMEYEDKLNSYWLWMNCHKEKEDVLKAKELVAASP